MNTYICTKILRTYICIVCISQQRLQFFFCNSTYKSHLSLTLILFDVLTFDNEWPPRGIKIISGKMLMFGKSFFTLGEISANVC